jgi:hypothetical protein
MSDQLPPEVQVLLDREREIPPVQALVRARVLARARTAIAAGPAAKAPPVRARPARLRWAMAAALLLMVSAVAGAAVYEVRARMAIRHVAPAPVRTALVATPAPRAPAATSDQPSPAPLPAPQRASEDTAIAELRLLRQARAAVARQDYAAALTPIAEHARRFKNGRLAEEREALDVRALAGLGRTDEARRAARHFEERFPRSVLLPAVKQMATVTP